MPAIVVLSKSAAVGGRVKEEDRRGNEGERKGGREGGGREGGREEEGSERGRREGEGEGRERGRGEKVRGREERRK